MPDYRRMKLRNSLMLALPLASLDSLAIKRELDKIGGAGLPK